MWIIQHAHAKFSTAGNLNIDLDNFKIHFLQPYNGSERTQSTLPMAVFSI
jgi:hypothetical protein